MKSSCMGVLTAFLMLVAIGSNAIAKVPAHNRAFWEELKQQNFKLSRPELAGALSLEAGDLLSSTQSELRDGIGYEALEAWIYRDEALLPEQMETLRIQLVRRAQVGLGESADDRVFGRSFAILGLSLIAAEDLRRPFMTRTAFDELLNLGLTALARERDLRGYVQGKGWAHATAHAADLLKFLARNSKLVPLEGNRIVAGITDRLRTAGRVFVWGEDSRLAAALGSVAVRQDVDAAPFVAWCERVGIDNRAVWSGTFDAERYVPLRTQLNTIAHLAAILRPGAGERADEIARSLRAALLDAG